MGLSSVFFACGVPWKINRDGHSTSCKFSFVFCFRFSTFQWVENVGGWVGCFGRQLIVPTLTTRLVKKKHEKKKNKTKENRGRAAAACVSAAHRNGQI